MATTHADLIVINVILAALLQQGAGFSTTMLIVDGNTSSLDGDRTRTYTSVAQATADQTAGFLSAQAVAFLTAAFSQNRAPSEVKVGRQAVAESITDAYTAIKDDDPNFYGVALESRAAADAVALAPVLVTDASNPDDRGRLLVVQSSDPDWRTTGIPAAYATIAGNTRTAVMFHTTDTVPAEFAWLTNRLAYDPDLVSVPWNTPIQAVMAYAPGVNATEKGFLRANFANPLLPNGNEPYFVDQGVTLEGRSISEILTADWFGLRLRESIQNRLNQLHGTGIKLPVNLTGQSVILGEINALFRTGLNGPSPHFQGRPLARALDITPADRTSRELRFSGEAELTIPGRKFTLNFTFTEQALTA